MWDWFYYFNVKFDKFLLSQSVFFYSQYGFWPLNYLSVNQFDIITSFENKQYTVVVFLDISMAFDKWL